MQVFRAADFTKSDDLFKVLMNTDRSQLAVMVLQNGEASGEFGSDHPHADQFLYVLEGNGQLILQGEDIELHPGDAVVIPGGLAHQFVGKSDHPMRSITVYSPVAYPDMAAEPPEADDDEAVSFDAEQRR
jgi:quercetin dioxygenase-like cupin family protein